MRLETIHDLYISTPFRKLREYCIIRDDATCCRCGAVYADDTAKLIAHHKKEVTLENLNDPSITLNADNIEIVCLDCHNAEHRRFGHERRGVYIVYGAPCSGKTSLVRQLARRGDIIIDIDSIWACLTGMPRYDKPGNLKTNVFAVHRLLVDQVRTRHGKWHDAYIVGGYPDKMERERVAAELGAKLIYCEATREECTKRLYSDPSRDRYKNQWEVYINEWFDKYDP